MLSTLVEVATELGEHERAHAHAVRALAMAEVLGPPHVDEAKAVLTKLEADRKRATRGKTDP